MPQTLIRPRLPQSWSLTSAEAQRITLSLMALATLASSQLTGTPAASLVLPLVLALVVAALVPERRVAAGLVLGVILVALGLLLLVKPVVLLGGVVLLVAPRLGQRPAAR
ncbi:hypothetical protein [Deinococcus aquaedulcis]|uniref:hypothetical protein n=1 Tax=Deinococcus aquaedulcis TaxID=2840455 RepID=UPI001C835437|nr:hypothetical protein [Deinococcus aquaedulcis]